jgi:hypothetical protein
MAKGVNEEYEGVLSAENLNDIEMIHQFEQENNQNQDDISFYQGKRGEMELKWIQEMEQMLEQRKEVDVKSPTALTEVFAAEKERVNATTQSKVLRMLLDTLSQYNLSDRRRRFLDGNAIKTFNPCGTLTCKERALHIREALTFLSMVPPEVLANMTKLDSYKRGFGSALGWNSTRKKTIDPNVTHVKQPTQYSSSGYNKLFGYHNATFDDKELAENWSREKLKGTNRDIFKKLKEPNKGKYYWSANDDERNEAKGVVNGKWRRPVKAYSQKNDLDYDDEPVYDTEIPVAEAAEIPVAEAVAVDGSKSSAPPLDQGWSKRTNGKNQTDYNDTGSSQLDVPSASAESVEETSAPQPSAPKNPEQDDELAPTLVDQGWSKHTNEQNQTYYHNKETGSSQWERPKLPPPPPAPPKKVEPFLPSPWEKYEDTTGRLYYHNPVKNITTYEPPPSYTGVGRSVVNNLIQFGKSTKPIDGGTFRKKKQRRRTRRVSK